MLIARKKPEPPTDDKRWKMIDVTMRRNGYAGHALIETLHTVQESSATWTKTSMQYVGRSLELPLSKVYGVATFYHLFTLKPQGKHTCVVCTGTACYIKGAGELLDGIQQKYDVGSARQRADDGFRCSVPAASGPVVWLRRPWSTVRCWASRSTSCCRGSKR